MGRRVFPWAYYEPSKGNFTWASADRIVDHANRQGLRVIARLGFVPEWARPKTMDDGRPGSEAATTFTHLDPQNYADFANYAAAFATHFKGRVQHIVIWNEPNLSGEWGLRPVDAKAYVEMLRAVYPAIKTANPNALVLAGALAPTLEPAGSPNGLNDLIYLEQMYEEIERSASITRTMPLPVRMMPGPSTPTAALPHRTKRLRLIGLIFAAPSYCAR